MTSRSRKNMSSVDRMASIKLVFAIAIQNGEKEWMTVNEVANKLDLARSPHLQNTLKRMVHDGQLTYREIEKDGRWPGYEYMLAPGTYIRPKRQRKIPINAKGKQAGQMEMQL